MTNTEKLNYAKIVKTFHVVGQIFIICSSQHRDLEIPNSVLPYAYNLYKLLDKWALSNGVGGVKKYKDISYYLTRLRLGEVIPPLSDKIDRKFWAFYRVCPKHYFGNTFFLSIIQLHRKYDNFLSTDLETVTIPFKGCNIFHKKFYFLMYDIYQFSKSFKKTHGDLSIKPFQLKWHISCASGPNSSKQTEAWRLFREDWNAIYNDIDYVLEGLFLLFICLPIINREESNLVITKLLDQESTPRGYLPVKYSKIVSILLRILFFLEWFLEYLPWPVSLLVPYISKYIGKIRKSNNVKYKTGRVVQFADKSGKTRTIAIGTIYCQSILKPVHDHVTLVTRKLFSSTDGTSDQEAQVNRIRDISSKKIWKESIDMTACTDRFPALHQSLILWFSGLLSFSQSLGWLILVTWRNFAFFKGKVELKPIKYAVGTPIGLLSSWSVITFCHHYLVRVAHFRKLRKHLPWIDPLLSVTFNRYSVLGDDNVTWDQETALEFTTILDEIGVEVNKTKSFSSYYTAEYAKAILHRGKLFKPIPYQLLSQISNSKVSIAISCMALVDWLKSMGWRMTSEEFISLLPERHSQFIFHALLLTGNFDGALDHEFVLMPNFQPSWWAFQLATCINIFSQDKTYFEIRYEIQITWQIPGWNIYKDEIPYKQVAEKNRDSYPVLIDYFREDILYFTVPLSFPYAISGIDFVCWDSRVELTLSCEDLVKQPWTSIIPPSKREVNETFKKVTLSTKFLKKVLKYKSRYPLSEDFFIKEAFFEF